MSHQFQATGAWYPWEDRRMAVMVGGTYELGHERQDRDLTPGGRFTINWGISQYLPLKKDLTLLAELGIRATASGSWTRIPVPPCRSC